MYINIAVQYLRPKQVTYVRDTLQAIVRELVEAADLDLESDPSIVCSALFISDIISVALQIHRARIDIEEMRSGRASAKPKDLPFYEALKDPDTRAEYIRRRQSLVNLISTTYETMSSRYAKVTMVERSFHGSYHPIN